MLKPAKKDNNLNPFSQKQVTVYEEGNEYKETLTIDEKDQKSAVIREYLAGPLYKELLGESAPDIILIEGEEKDEDIHIGSKYLENFQTFEEFTKNNKSETYKIKNLEKVIVSSLFLGDIDLNYGNLGVITKTLENGEKQYIAAKIDHGEAFKTFYENESQIKNQLYIILKKFEKKGVEVSYDVEKFKEAIEEINSASFLEKAKELIKSRNSELEKAGFLAPKELEYFVDRLNLEGQRNSQSDDKKKLSIIIMIFQILLTKILSFNILLLKN